MYKRQVYFPEIGWVPFDPTPSAAPAAAQTADREADAASGGGAGTTGQARGLIDRQTQSGGPLGPLEEPRSRGRTAAVAVAIAVASCVVGLWLRALVLRRRRRGEAEPELRELEVALGRLGYELPAGTTLLGLEPVSYTHLTLPTTPYV